MVLKLIEIIKVRIMFNKVDLESLHLLYLDYFLIYIIK